MAEITTNDDNDELRGALPPSEEVQESTDFQEKPDEQVQTDQSTLSRLKQWGPWKRWTWYQKVRRPNREDREFYRDNDLEENEKGRLPDDEGVQVPAIWVAELYTPSTVMGLLKGIRDLGWEYSRNRDSSLTKWMNDVREGRQAGWTSLGLVSPPEDLHFMRDRTAPLPSGVTAALPILMSLTPSLTAFVIVFLFDEEAACSLEEPLRAEFSTRSDKDPLFRPWHVVRYLLVGGSLRLGRRIFSPDLIRRDTVKSRLQDLEHSCMKWVRNRLPGVFSSLKCSRFPTAVLLVTEQCSPLSEDSKGIRAFDGLAINRDFDAWESSEWPGARLVLPRGWDEEGRRLIFACRRHDAFPEEPGYHDPTSNWTIAQRADDRIQGLLSRWAITCLLDSYHETLAGLRDRAAHDGGYRPVTDLKVLRSLSRTMFYDIGACTKEVVEFSKSAPRYRHNVLEMTYVREMRGGGRPELLKNLTTSQGRRAQQIQREAELLSSTLSASNNLTQTISSIRTQRLVILLTIVSIGVASWAAFLTFRTAS